MYELFSKRYEENNDVIIPGYGILDNYKEQILEIQKHYKMSNHFVESNHLFCRIITTALSGMSYDIHRFNQLNNLRANNYAKHFELTSEVSYGKFRKDFLYKGLTGILSISEYFDAEEAYRNWESIIPVEVIHHNVSNTEFLLPSNPTLNSEYGVNYIKLDIPKLLIMYRAFYERQFTKIGTDKTNASIGQFVFKYVLTNMMKSHSELVIHNRLSNIISGEPMGEAYKHHPFINLSQTKKIDSILQSIANHISKRPMHYFSILKNIPSIFNSDFQNFGILPDLAPTKQVWWFLLMSKRKVMETLLSINKDKNISLNKFYINDLRIDLQRLNRDNSLEFMKQNDLFMDDILFVKEYGH